MNFIINFVDYIEKNYPLHKHSTYEIITYLRGHGQLCTPTESYNVSQGTIIVVPPGTLHSTVSDGNLQGIYINGELSQVLNFTSPVTITDNENHEGALLARMIYNNRYGNSDYIGALCNTYVHFILQNFKMDDVIGSAVREIINAIVDGFHDSSIDLCSLLNKSGYAEDYIRSHFKRLTGKTPNEFLTEIRIKHACYLIDIYKNTLSLSDIALKCGYTDYAYFSRRFKKVMGISPQKYKTNF